MKEDEFIGTRTQKIGTLQHFRWLRGVVSAVLILNLIDAVLTLLVVSSGWATEANPLLHRLAHETPLYFMIVKLLLVSLGSYLLWLNRKRAFAVFAIFAVFIAYYLVLLHHLRGMNLRLLSRMFE